MFKQASGLDKPPRSLSYVHGGNMGVLVCPHPSVSTTIAPVATAGSLGGGETNPIAAAVVSAVAVGQHSGRQSRQVDIA